MSAITPLSEAKRTSPPLPVALQMPLHDAGAAAAPQ